MNILINLNVKHYQIFRLVRYYNINEQQSVHDLINKKDQRLEKKLIFFSRSTSAKA